MTPTLTMQAIATRTSERVRAELLRHASPGGTGAARLVDRSGGDAGGGPGVTLSEKLFYVKATLGVASTSLLLLTPFAVNNVFQGRSLVGAGSLIHRRGPDGDGVEQQPRPLSPQPHVGEPGPGDPVLF